MANPALLPRVNGAHKRESAADPAKTPIGRRSAGAGAGVPLFLRSSLPVTPSAPVQMKCAACEPEEAQAVQSQVQFWDCTEYTEPNCEPVQAKCAECEAEEEEQEAGSATHAIQLWDCTEYTEPTCVQTKPVQTKCAECEQEEEDHVQHAGTPPVRNPAMIRREAGRGLANASEPLPHSERIQAAFGRHDISNIRTAVGGPAAKANRRMGSLAFASGDSIGFRQDPDLRLAAHEAAHVVQQRSGLSLPGNVGKPGDRWERHADHVADAVVEGRSAEPLLDTVAPHRESSDDSAEANAEPEVQQQITSRASRLFEPPTPDIGAPRSAGGPAAPAPAPATGGAEGEGATEGSVEEEAEEGPAEAPPEGVPEAGAGGGAASPAAQPAEEGGGPANAGCYNAKSPAPPDNTPEPTNDDRSTKPEAEAQVTFPEWEDLPDTCPPPAPAGNAQLPPELAQGQAGQAPTLQTATPVLASRSAEGAAAASATNPAGASASPEVRQMAGAAEETSAASTAPADGMEAAVAGAEAHRDGAVSEYVGATGVLSEAEAKSLSLDAGITFGSQGSAEDLAAAREQVSAFMRGMTDQVSAAISFARNDIPARLGGLAEMIKANLQGTIETEKAAVSNRAAQARAVAWGSAEAARGHVEAEYSSSMALIESETLAAVATLDEAHTLSLAQVDEKETLGLADVNSRFATGRTQHEDKGPEYSAKAIQKGQRYVSAYEPCKGDYSDDGFWDGCLTVRRAKAQQDAACKAAAGFKDGAHQTANKAAYDLIELRKQYRCAVIDGARKVRETLDSAHEQLVSALENGRMQAIAGLDSGRTQNLAAIDAALWSTLQRISAQEASQRQSINDTGYLKQLAIEQLAHSSASNLSRGVAAAVNSLEDALGQVREQLATAGGVPEPASLARMLATVQGSVAGGMGTLLGGMQEGLVGAEGSLDALGSSSLAALTGLTMDHDEQTSQVESAFTGQMRGVMSGVTKSFGQITENHVTKAQQSATEGSASMEAAVTAFDDALTSIGGKVDEAIATSLGQLDKRLSDSLAKLDGQIVSDAWKAAKKEQPAWKSVVAIIVTVLVIIAAAVISIVTLGAGASLLAIILVGALVGAVSAGLIQIVNNWAAGEEWHKGVGQAMIIGAIGGAIGGGFGFAGGALAAGAAQVGARVATQFAIQVGADLVAEAVTQTIGYVAFGQEFNWQGFAMAGAMSGVSFRAHPSGARPGAAAAAATPSPGAAAGRRAAVTQVAGGAAVGIGVEAATAAITGEKFDISRAASAAASGAVGARASRRAPAGGGVEVPPARRGGGAPAAPETPSLTSRISSRLEQAGARLVGGRLEPQVPAGGRPPGGVAEPPVRPAGAEEVSAPPARPAAGETTPPTRPPEEAPAAAPRPTEEAAPAARRPEAGPEAGPTRTTHPDAPEIEPGVVARVPSADGHDVKVTSSGKVVVCSTCGELARLFEPELRTSHSMEAELLAVERMTNPQEKAVAAARLHARLISFRDLANISVGRPIITGGGDVSVARIRAAATSHGLPEGRVAAHVSELIRTGRHPAGVAPDGEYGQTLLRVAEAVVGPRLAEVPGPTPRTPEISRAAEFTPEAITRAKAEADVRAREGLEPTAEQMAARRAEAGPQGPEARTAREVAAEALNPPGEAPRSTRVGEGRLPVRESPRGEHNVFVRGLDTYDSIVARARAIGRRLGIPEADVDVRLARAIQEFFHSGRTPEGLTGRNVQQRRDARFFAQLERLLLHTETRRSPTNLADVAQVLRAVAEGRLPLDSLSLDFPAGLAARKGDPRAGILPREGGSPGSRRALERAEGAARRENALDRAADEIFGRQRRLGESDPALRTARDEAALSQIFFRDIIRTVFGGNL